MVVKQRRSSDCAICCIAMFLNRTYNEAETLVKCHLKNFSGNGINFDQISKVLFPMYRMGLCRTIIKGVPAILAVPSLVVPKKYHFVYYDGQEIHDPSNSTNKYRTADLLSDMPVILALMESRLLIGMNKHFVIDMDWDYINANY